MNIYSFIGFTVGGTLMAIVLTSLIVFIAKKMNKKEYKHIIISCLVAYLIAVILSAAGHQEWGRFSFNAFAYSAILYVIPYTLAFIYQKYRYAKALKLK